MEPQIADALEKLLAHMDATRVHTWHGKETPHAHLLAQMSGTFDRARHPKSLHRFYGQVYSQHGEDGYIAEIFSRIGQGRKTFLEIGVENGLQNTTRFLLEQGWRGAWIEGNEEYAKEARRTFSSFIEAGSLNVISASVTAENINDLVEKIDLGNDFDLISVDIDFNTSHVWRALNARGRAYCIEYNSSIPPGVTAEVEYDAQGIWDGTNYFGAGLKVIENIGRQKKASLVGCDLQGVNAFLVAEEESEKFMGPFTAETHYELPKYSLHTHIGHQPSRHARKWSVSQ